MIVQHIGKGADFDGGEGVEVMLGGGRGRGCACDRHQHWRRRPSRPDGLRWAMQDFEFQVYDVLQAGPSVMLVLTRDEDSARTMAERILRETKGCSHIDVWVARRRLFTVEAQQSAGGQGAGLNSVVSRSSFWSAFRKSGLRFRDKTHARLFESLA